MRELLLSLTPPRPPYEYYGARFPFQLQAPAGGPSAADLFCILSAGVNLHMVAGGEGQGGGGRGGQWADGEARLCLFAHELVCSHGDCDICTAGV